MQQVGAWRGKAHVLLPWHCTPKGPTAHTQNLESTWTGLSGALECRTHTQEMKIHRFQEGAPKSV